MSSFEDRQKGYENKFARDQEMTFKVNARRNKLLGLWAAGKMGRVGEAAEAYAKDVVMADLESAGDDDVVQKLLADFANKKVAITEKEIKLEMHRLLEVAREQLGGNAA